MDPQPDDIISLQREKGSGDNAGRLRTPRNRLIPGVVNEHKPTNEEKVPATIISNLLKPSTDSVSGQADHSVDLPRGATEDSPFIQDTSPSIPNGPPEVTTGGSQSSQYDNYWWYLEILGIVASIAAMVLVVITLHLVQDKPLHDWTFFFQPNTVLSALVTAAKSAMLFSIAECLGQLKWIYYWHCKEKRRLQTLEVFDGASRGPWGAVKFYFSIRSYVPIGAMASFVTILTLGMDPFTQQIISFQTRFVDAPGEIATIPISNKFNVKHTVSQQYTNIELEDAPLKGSFYRGLFDMNGALDFTCASSNCTWPDFSTLALCSKCEDVTALTEVEKQNCTGYDLVSDSPRFNFLACDKYLLTMPNNGELAAVVGEKNGTARNADGAWLSSIIGTQFVSSNSPGPYSDDLALSNVINMAKFQWNASWSFETASQMMATEFEASQCSISWCLKRYMGVNVTNGILNSFSTEDLSGRLETDTATSNYVFAADAPLPDVAPWANASDFHLEFALYNQVFLWLGQKLAFNFTNQSSDEQFEDFLVFLQNTNTSGIIQNIAASITDRIRHNYDDVFAEGSSLRPVVYVAVEWPWIILPVGAVLLSTIVLGMTVWTNHRHNAPLWKSGLMPLFFHGLDGWDSDELRVENRQEMDKRAKEMHARLQRRDNGDIRFVRMERSHSI